MNMRGIYEIFLIIARIREATKHGLRGLGFDNISIAFLFLF